MFPFSSPLDSRNLLKISDITAFNKIAIVEVMCHLITPKDGHKHELEKDLGCTSVVMYSRVLFHNSHTWRITLKTLR
jgi:hypothetical protein